MKNPKIINLILLLFFTELSTLSYGQSNNADLASVTSTTLTVSNEDLVFEEDEAGSGVYVGNDSISINAFVVLEVDAADPDALVEIERELNPAPGGADTVDVMVTAPDGETIKSYKVVAKRSNYYFKIGFLNDALNTPSGWSAGGGRYASSSRGEYGLYPGANGYRIYNSSNSGEGYLTSPIVPNAGVLTFAAKFSKTEDESLILEKSQDDGATWTEIKSWLPSDNEIPSYTTEDAADVLALQEVAINSEGPLQLRFRYLGTSTNPRTMLDDIALTTFGEVSTYTISLPLELGSNMVFQRETPAKFWGETVPYTKVVATMENTTTTHTSSIVSDNEGKWTIEFPAQTASFDPYTISFMVENERESEVVLENVFCGDVWLVGGQSNMEKRVDHLPESEAKAVAASAKDYPHIRAFRSTYSMSETPLDEVSSSSWPWYVCDSADTYNKTSAVGYIYAQELAKSQNIPIGLLQAYRGGTEIETWMSPDIINNEPALHRVKERMQSIDPTDNIYPTVHYNGQINPLTKYPIKGFIYYQGESNTKRALEYTDMMKYLIKDWRQKWNMGDLPFYYVQLFNMGRTESTLYEESNWADARYAQLQLRDEGISNIGMAVSIDTNEDPDNEDASIRIHPQNKKPIGLRLASLSRQLTYGEAINGISPFPKTHYVRNDTVFVEFSYYGTALQIQDTSTSELLEGFIIADDSKNWTEATATFENDSTIAITSNQVNAPVAVRYAWTKNPTCNLANSENLPASPFKTDDWLSGYDYSEFSSYTDATLHAVMIDGIPVGHFDPNTKNLEVQLPVNTADVSLSAEPNSAVAKVEITDYTNLDGTTAERTTTIEVTSGDGTVTNTYEVVFNKEPMDIFVAFGQSNMAGRAPITDEVSDTILNAKLLVDKGNWGEAKNPFNLYSNIRKDASMQQVGPSYSFAKTIVQFIDEPIGIVVNARGGTPISSFIDGGEYHETIMKRISGLSDFGQVKGILWHQGESDNSSSSTYMDKLSSLVADLRDPLGEVPFIAGQMGGWTLDGESTPKYESINQVISTIENNITNSTYVSNSELDHIGDGAHFNLESQILLGQRYAQKILSSEYGIDVSIIKVISSGEGELMIDTKGLGDKRLYSITKLSNEETAMQLKVAERSLIKKLSINGTEINEAEGASEYTINLIPEKDEITIQVTLEMVSTALSDDVSTIAEVVVYPNATSSLLNLKSEKKINKLLVYDSSGNVYINMNSKKDLETVQLSELPQGIYYLQLFNEGDIVIRKVIKH